MRFLINASDIKAGGGVQVTDSICCELDKYPQHHFVVVLASYLQKTADRIKDYSNVEVVNYSYNKYDLKLLLTGRDKVLDKLVEAKNIQAVLSVFGPNLWVPKCPHISGFARSQLIVPESPYFLRMGTIERLKEKFLNRVLKYFFKRSSTIFYTENPFVTERWKKSLPHATVYTITNNYNQVFEQKDKWIDKKLPEFEGATFLCVTAAYPHKNLEIAIDIAKYLKKTRPDFKFRFVFTIDKTEFPELTPDLEDAFLFIGKVDIAECPPLYNQCTIAFQPTLLESFTATYPEAMVMGKPIVTTNLDFAKGLCGNAACYYESTDPIAAANALYKVVSDSNYAKSLVNAGREQLKQFDTYSDRAEKLIGLLQEVFNK